jgi:hypothetical protein
MISSERGEPGIGGQKGDQGILASILISLINETSHLIAE